MSQPVNPGTQVLLAPYAHEREGAADLEEKLRTLARAHGCEPGQTVQRIHQSDLKPGLVVITDTLSRSGQSAIDVLRWLSTALEKEVKIYVLDGLALEPGTPNYVAARVVLRAIADTSRERRSLKTRESLFLARQRGVTLGRSPLSHETIRAVLRVFESIGTIRGTARRLQDAGIKISKSAVGRIIADHKKRRK